MKSISRRTFVKGSLAFGGAMLVSPYVNGHLWPGTDLVQDGYFQKEFGIDEALCHKLLTKAMSTGGDFADVFIEHTVSNWLILEDGKVNQSYTDIKLGVGIRTIKDQQVAYGFTQNLTEESMLSAAATAATIVNSSPKSLKNSYTRAMSPSYYPTRVEDLDIPLSSKLPLVKAVNEKCFSLSDKVLKVNVGLHDSIRRIQVYSSNGVQAEDVQPRNFLFTQVTAKKGDKVESSFYNYGGRHDFSYYTHDLAEKLAGESVRRVSTLFDAKQPPAGEMPVVLGPGITGILLHEAIGHGMEADFNRKKVSAFSTMIGKKVAEPFVTIIDDSRNTNQNGSLHFDDEGTPGKETILVENGILTSYLHDKISAKYYGVEPTGNGRRESFEHYPQPRMCNTYMAGGNASREDVIKRAKNGIYVEDVANGQVMIGEGDFSFYVSQGRRIEDGKLTSPIKDVNIMGNGPKMLANITMAANDLKFHQGGAGNCGKGGQAVPVSFGLPTCLVKSMTVGGTEQKGGMS